MIDDVINFLMALPVPLKIAVVILIAGMIIAPVRKYLKPALCISSVFVVLLLIVKPDATSANTDLPAEKGCCPVAVAVTDTTKAFPAQSRDSKASAPKTPKAGSVNSGVSKNNFTQAGCGLGRICWSGGGNRVVTYKPPIPIIPDSVPAGEYTIKIRFYVDPSGSVIRAVPVNKVDPRLEEVAIRYVKRYKFNPLDTDVTMVGTINICFRMN